MAVPKDENEVGYAISKMVPDIEVRAVFSTAYGELTLEGKAAERIAAVVKRELKNMLQKSRGKK